MSNLAAMFGGGAGLGGLAAGVPPVQDPETAYASQLTQLQARELRIPCPALSMTIMLLASSWIDVLAHITCHVIQDIGSIATHCVFSACLIFHEHHYNACTSVYLNPRIPEHQRSMSVPLSGTYVRLQTP